MRKSQPRTVKVEGPDGHPVLGAIVSPRFFTADPSRGHGEVPEALIRSLAVTTGPDGTATLKYLAVGEKLVTVRLTAAAIGTQDLQLLATPFLDNQGAMITIRLKPTRRLAGRVRNRSGKPVAGQEVEVWLKGSTWLPMGPVAFENGPVRTATDGTFRTPENLLVGSSYRAVILRTGV